MRVREDSQTGKKTSWGLLAGVGLISFSLLALEITLTRLLSVMLLYHYVFIVVSLALLGLGAGGIFVYLFRRNLTAEAPRYDVLAKSASLIALSIPLAVLIMVLVGYVEFLGNAILVYGVLLFVPFFFAGKLFAEVFRMFPAMSARIYGADLTGAALGSLGVIFLLDALGAINTSFLLGMVVGAAALLFASKLLGRSTRQVIASASSLLLTVAILGANMLGAYLPDVPIVDVSPGKEMSLAISEPSSQGEIIESRWSAFGRTDLVKFNQRPGQMKLYVDGTAGSPMYQFTGNLGDPGEEVSRLKDTFTGYFPFFFLSPAEKQNALLIGPGGGRDIVMALMGGIEEITAVEVNADQIDIVRAYSEYNGGILTRFSNVRVVVDEGRNFLKRQPEQYDLIFLSLPVTQTSRSLEGYALTENFLFTTESISDYLEHLTDEGQLIVVSHDDFTTWKLLAVSLAALEEKGLSTQAAMERIYLLGLSTPGTYPLFVLKKTSLAPAEAAILHEKMRQLGYTPTLSYFPQVKEKGMVNELLFDLSRGQITFNEVKRNLARNAGIDVSPVTDNRPFFYKIDIGLPSQVSLVLWLSVGLMLVALTVPALVWRRRPAGQKVQHPSKRPARPVVLRALFLFSMLGIGFMLIEISLIQKFMLFLGQPVLSLTIVLFSLLAGSGLGSLHSGRYAPETLTRKIVTFSLATMAIAVAYALVLPVLFEWLLGLALAVRLLVTAVLLFPLGFAMGHLFPLGMRGLKQGTAEDYIPWVWGVNGVGSVLGSVATIAIAMTAGFAQALLAGAGCYLLTALVFAQHHEGTLRRLR